MRAELPALQAPAPGTFETVKNTVQTTLTPPRRFPEFCGVKPWDEKELGELSKIIRGGSPRPIDGYLTNDPNGLNWLKIGDVDKDAKYVESTEERVIPEALSKTREVHSGDFILSNSMSFGRPYLLKITTCIHDGWIAVTDITKTIDHEFLYYLLMSPRCQRFFEDQAAGGGVRNLNKEIIKSLPVGYPTKDEQRKIADCMGSLDKWIAAVRWKLAALRDHKRGLLQQIFPKPGQSQPQQRFSEFQDKPKWSPKTIGELARIQSGATPSKSHPHYWGGSIPWVSAKDMKMLRLEDSEDHVTQIAIDDGAKLVPAGTLLMLTRGMTLLKDVPICLLQRPMTFNQDVKALHPRKGVVGDFLAYLLVANKPRIRALVDIAGHGTGRLNTDELKALELFIPEKTEQQKIAACLTILDAQIAAETQQLATLQQHKRGLMQQLFPLPEGP